ncbi:MAG: hypothetical protein J5529_00220 [Prevotella sp.]|nr:hypothetical protein [Prevotella sp.]
MKIRLYEQRSMLECLEATMDFLRANRRVWWRTALLLFLPVALAMALTTFATIDDDRINHNIFFWFENMVENLDRHATLLVVAIYVGVWMVITQVYALLLANEAEEKGVSRLTLIQMRPWLLRTAKHSWSIPIILFIMASMAVVVANPLLTILLAVLAVPMALLPSLWLMEGKRWLTALKKTVKMGFSTWFPLAFNIALVSLLGMYVFVFLWLPTGLLSLLQEIFSYRQVSELEEHFVYALGFVFTTAAFFGFHIVASMVVLVCAFEYGSVSEEEDATSLEEEVAHFEDL